MAGQTEQMRVVIVGGGTGGWMSAASLAKYLGSRVQITLIESEQIGTIGVGEATIPQIRLFNKGLGIEERDFLRGTKGTLKLGIRFSNWYRKGESYFHGFGEVGRTIGLVPFYHYWLRYQREGGTLPLDAFSPCVLAAEEGRYGPGDGVKAVRLPASAYHFDAARYAGFLRGYAEARGVVRREGKVKGWEQDGESGHITELTLEDGAALEGDLFIDCSGMRGLLIEQALEAGWEDWSHWLPCDRALAVPSEGNGRLDPFTRAIAHDAGWQWQIPLQHRTGNGHVFASAFTSEEAAWETLRANLPGRVLADPKPIRFTTGKRAKAWVGNCVAIGLSGGFLEPLESTSIHLIQSGIARLLALFPERDCDPALRDAYNAQTDFEYAAIRDFLILHYHATARDDTEFWRYCREMAIPDSLSEKLDLFRSAGRIVRYNSELFDVPSWLQVMLGQGVVPARYHPMVDAAPEADLQRYIDMNAQETRAQVDGLGDHAGFVARMVRKQPVAAG